jgi:hypothetical protein
MTPPTEHPTDQAAGPRTDHPAEVRAATVGASGVDLFDLHLLRYEAAVVSWSQRLLHEGIDHVILKGPGFDRWLARSRVPRDIDVLVPRWRLRRLARILSDEGYQRVSTEPTATTWAGPDGTVPLDVHDSFKAVGASHAEVWEACASTRSWVRMGHTSVPVEGSPVRELHVVLHLAHAGLGDPRARDDFERAVEVTTSEEWSQVLALSARLRCRGVVEAVLGTVPSAAEVHRALGLGDRPAPWLADDSRSREYAMSMLSVTLQSGVVERMRLTGRLCRLHAAPGPTDGEPESALRGQVNAVSRRAGEFSNATAMTWQIHRSIRST